MNMPKMRPARGELSPVTASPPPFYERRDEFGGGLAHGGLQSGDPLAREDGI